jgi:hypothetical protein
MYKELYLILFRAITDALELLEKRKYASAALLLKNAQIKTEELYISMPETAEIVEVDFGQTDTPD